MANRLTQEDQLILSQLERFCADRIPAFYHLKETHQFPLDLFRELGQLGVTGINTSEAYGGLDKSSYFTSKVMEVVASVDLGPAIFLSVHLMVAKIIERFANDEMKSKFLPYMVEGKMLGAFALTEPHAGSDAASLKTFAKQQDDSFVLNGEKCYITSAGAADLYVVFARTTPQTAQSNNKDGISAFIVPASAKGLVVSKPDKKMGCELSPIASLTFDNVTINKSHLLGELNKGYKIALSGLASGRINIGACANGISKHAINLASNYMKERTQFNQKISQFQGLQFMLADMRIKYESAKCTVEAAACALDDGQDNGNPNLYPSIAKCLATDNAMSIATDAVQIFGGAGYIKDYNVESLMRDAKMLQIVEGSNQIQRSLIARATLS
jgi:alkylation response protein AidB-like acyl-CoA dehydrogenase